MTPQEIIAFSALPDFRATIIAIKNEIGTITGYIKECPMIITQKESEEELVRSMGIIYGIVKDFIWDDMGLPTPNITGFDVKYISAKEWME